MSLDFDARYSVDGYPGVAWWLKRYETWLELDELGIEYEECTDENFVIAVMVGDDREHIVDVDDLTEIADNEYCHTCGQIGCSHDW